MERALFLVEATGERISALLNPEHLTLTRVSGLRSLTHGAGAVTGAGLSDTPLVSTGGGVTELTLNLLFDSDLSDAYPLQRTSEAGFAQTAAEPLRLDRLRPRDVRQLTRPFWNLAENTGTSRRAGLVPQVRFIWGCSWNILAAVIDVAERFERFDPEGQPRRSFLRMRLRRLPENLGTAPNVGTGGTYLKTASFFEPPPAATPDALGATRITIEIDGNGLPAPRLEQIAAEHTGNPDNWRIIADYNVIVDPLHLEPGQIITLPPMTMYGSSTGLETGSMRL